MFLILIAHCQYSTEGKIKEPNVALGAAKGLLSTFASFQRSDVRGVVNGVTNVLHVASGSTQKATQYTRATRSSAADVVRWLHLYLHILTTLIPTQMSWSGCKDTQTSADAQIGGRNTGAMSDVRASHSLPIFPPKYLPDHHDARRF